MFDRGVSEIRVAGPLIYSLKIIATIDVSKRRIRNGGGQLTDKPSPHCFRELSVSSEVSERTIPRGAIGFLILVSVTMIFLQERINGFTAEPEHRLTQVTL